MSEVKRISNQFSRVFKANAWYGKSVLEVLQNVNHTQAGQKPHGSLHSIWEILLHMEAWLFVVRNRIQGNPMNEPPLGDWPAVESITSESWQIALQKFNSEINALKAVIDTLDDSDLNKTPAGSTDSLYLQINGIIHHSVYHIGQIAVIKKLLGIV